MNMRRYLFARSGKILALAGLGILLMAIALVCRQYLEQTMARHMLLQIPMLIIGGAAVGRALSLAGVKAGRLRAYDEHGITGLLAFVLVTGYWMMPKVLDSALTSAATEQCKILSLVAAGFVLPASLSRANTIIQLFFLGNFAPMMAVAGMLYQDAPVRLCNSYLIDDQVVAGTGLVMLALAVPLLWCAYQFEWVPRAWRANRRRPVGA